MGKNKKDKTKSKTNKRLYPLVIANAILIALIVVGAIFAVQMEPFELVGDKDTVVNLGEEFEDLGTTSQLAEVSGNVDTNTVGDYVVTYTKGKRSLTRNVHVVDPSKLVIGLKGSENAIVKEGEPYIESGAFLISKDKGALDASNIEITGDVDTGTPGDYEVTYTGRDGYTSKSITRTVSVVSEDEFTASEGVPVLMYHYVYTEEDQPDSINVNYILDTRLEEQLQYLTENEYYFPSFTELRAYADGKISLPEKSVILTFDDGQKGFLKYGIPLLEKYNVPATSFIIGVKDGEEKIKTYASSYVQFQSHSYNMHRPGGNIGHGGVISALSQEEIVEDLKESFTLVGNSNAFAYPFGDVTETAKAAVEESGVECAFTTQEGRVHQGDDFRNFSRVRISGTNSLAIYINSVQ